VRPDFQAIGVLPEPPDRVRSASRAACLGRPWLTGAGAAPDAAPFAAPGPWPIAGRGCL